MKFYTADICDELQDEVQVFEPVFKPYGGVEAAFGPIRTLRLERNNTELIAMLKEPGNDAFLVVDVAAEYWAVVGENLMKLAHHNGWAGILVNGYVRDIHVTQTVPVGLWALGTCPRKSFEHNPAERGVPLSFGGVELKEGEWLLADRDGVIVVTDEAMERLQEKLF
ncbi:ribonuclease E activity regulator RraA [Hydrogenimonas sp. SS33]|uniref:ribonuclease E activity regulator RraA n=1 Tax=Hydrogenimonas leucolamina TaxID=2954236 RepID=UPI00336BDE86